MSQLQSSIVNTGCVDNVNISSPTPEIGNPPAPKKKTEQNLNCGVCNTEGNTSNLVTCDECKKFYHFTCLDPPLKKTPKRRGYSWHCADCDPTVSIFLFYFVKNDGNY